MSDFNTVTHDVQIRWPLSEGRVGEAENERTKALKNT